MFGGVRECFGDDVIPGDLDGRRRPLVDVEVEVDGNRRSARKGFEGRAKPRLGEPGGVKAVGQLADVFEHTYELVLDPLELCAELPLDGWDRCADGLEVETQRDQPLLCAVVGVPLALVACSVSVGEQS